MTAKWLVKAALFSIAASNTTKANRPKLSDGTGRLRSHSASTKWSFIIMSQNLALEHYGEIRVTPDSRYSIFDVIELTLRRLKDGGF